MDLRRQQKLGIEKLKYAATLFLHHTMAVTESDLTKYVLHCVNTAGEAEHFAQTNEGNIPEDHVYIVIDASRYCELAAVVSCHKYAQRYEIVEAASNTPLSKKHSDFIKRNHDRESGYEYKTLYEARGSANFWEGLRVNKSHSRVIYYTSYGS